MTTIQDYQRPVFIINPDNEVEQMTYEEYLNEYHSDDTTSPHGVANRIHIREKRGDIYTNVDTAENINESDYDNLDEDEQDNYKWVGEATIAWEVWTWGVLGNNPRYLDTYDTEEEAYLSILEGKEYQYSNGNYDYPPHYESFEEAESQRLEYSAESMGVDIEVYKSIEHKQHIVDAARNQRELAAKAIAESNKRADYEQYKNIISRVDGESYRDTCNRLSAALGKKISGGAFHQIVKFVRL